VLENEDSVSKFITAITMMLIDIGCIVKEFQDGPNIWFYLDSTF